MRLALVAVLLASGCEDECVSSLCKRMDLRTWCSSGPSCSVNGEAVMSLLQDLHRAGATICMVTHDQRFAKHAGRTIHLFDGRVVEEEKGEERAHSEEALKESGYRVS